MDPNETDNDPMAHYPLFAMWLSNYGLEQCGLPPKDSQGYNCTSGDEQVVPALSDQLSQDAQLGNIGGQAPQSNLFLAGPDAASQADEQPQSQLPIPAVQAEPMATEAEQPGQPLQQGLQPMPFVLPFNRANTQAQQS